MEGNPNALAYLALMLCPFISIAIVALFRAPISVPIVILAGQMFLPPVIKLGIPLARLDKDTLPALGALVGCLIFRSRSLARSRPWRGYDLFILVHMLGLLGTTLTNREPIRYGPTVLPGLTFYDFFHNALNVALYWWPPFFLGRNLYRSSKDLKALFAILAIAGVVYSFFLFVEMVMSPQLNRWFYGFHQTEFLQTIRAGGYRPKAFMRHGLNVALFMLITLMAAITLAKNKQRIGVIPGTVVVLYLAVVLILCRSLGVLVYAAAFVPLMYFVSPRNQVKWAAAFALVIFSYPLSRAVGWVPIEEINAFATKHFGAERAASLAMRLREEGHVMTRALSRIFFGWGGYARQFRHDAWSGRSLALIDGQWAIQFGMRGIVGYTAMFGMLLLPAWRARRTLAKMVAPRDRAMVAALALMAVAYTLDLIPNSSIDPYLTFLVGVLAGTERGLDHTPSQPSDFARGAYGSPAVERS
ncbi:MAG: hypothetical protein H7X95_09790 [Deltaproteobacteria bacterium]|nr:hypothetical protein [Deltaproteobacteria bacterium]